MIDIDAFNQYMEQTLGFDSMFSMSFDSLIDIDNRAKGSGGYAAYVKSNPWDKVKEDFGDENLKKVVKLYFEYKGYEYNGEIEKNELIKITTSEFETFIKDKISSIKVNVSF
jgi:hypothetical protein